MCQRVLVPSTNIETNTNVQGRPTELIFQAKRVRYRYDSNGRVVHKSITANILLKEIITMYL